MLMLQTFVAARPLGLVVDELVTAFGCLFLPSRESTGTLHGFLESNVDRYA